MKTAEDIRERLNGIRRRLRDLFLHKGSNEGPFCRTTDDGDVVFIHKGRLLASLSTHELRTRTDDEICARLARVVDDFFARNSVGAS